VRFPLNEELKNKIKEIKKYLRIKGNTELLKNLITNKYEEILKIKSQIK